MELGRKKLVIIIVAGIAAVSAAGGLYLTLSDDSADDQRRDGRFRIVDDPNLPNPDKQKPQEILAYMDSDKFKQLSSRERMNYFRASGRKIIEHQVDTYFSLPEEEKVAHLDNIIDRMQTMREDMARQREQRQAQRAVEGQNDPDRQRRRQNRQGRGGRGRRDPSRMRARRERGTPERRAQRRQFFRALSNRATKRGVEMFGSRSRPSR